MSKHFLPPIKLPNFLKSLQKWNKAIKDTDEMIKFQQIIDIIYDLENFTLEEKKKICLELAWDIIVEHDNLNPLILEVEKKSFISDITSQK